ncbi:MAG: CrcB family protein [Microbacterium sp.]|uniref:fluoride efflux transporter FluC n=1 Tax=Microbacterium sp. TaxID=51671 RepID=UPI0039E354FD
MTEPTPRSDEIPVLPIDPDVEVAQSAGAPRPVHLRPAYIAVVFAGGALGTAAREALSLAFPPADGIPFVILGINVAGAFLLGFLLDALVRRGPDEGTRRMLRLLLGTGVMGGFTTYSALAADAARLIGSGSALAGILYGLATVLVGAAATWAGIALAAATHRASRRADR